MKLVFHGVVQGVGFRPTVANIARDLELTGHVRNNGSNVEVVVDGREDDFIAELKAKLPPLARIDRIEKLGGEAEPEGHDFEILPSSSGSRTSPIPPDACMCGTCLAELVDSRDRRYGHAFTNCTDCGARFSIIRDLPYDRDKTTMDDFPMCDECQAEYESQDDRRFHAQTISCPKCGPKYTFYDGRKNALAGGIPAFVEKLNQGEFGVIKGWGGSHLCCTLAATPQLREWYGRKEKPFAVMVRDETAVADYAIASQEEVELLTSRARPIVLLRKKPGVNILDTVSPGLPNVGIMLPYSAVHHFMFEHMADDALIMTSANPADEPMSITEEAILDFGIPNNLLHDREIANRCDDSLVIRHAGHNYFIRKSRGFVPVPVELESARNLLGIGAQENLASAIASDGFVYPSQYIGNASKYGVLDFLESATRHMMNLRGIEELDAVAIDLHPGYSTRKLGKAFAEEFGAPLFEIQHHHAHAASLLADAQIDEAVVLALDGTGYGDDGVAWGGEVLVSSYSEYKRAGHLQEFPLIGGEAAVKNPRRLVFAISELLGRENSQFPENEAEVMRKMMGSAPRTTAMGRTLDAVSSALGICHTRTYDGEPAMKLEMYLATGGSATDGSAAAGIQHTKFETFSKGGVVDTRSLFETLFSEIEGQELTDALRTELASGFVNALMKELCALAVETADTEGISHIGISGGCAFNIPIVEMAASHIEDAGHDLVRHDRVPCGDGGISTGQCCIISKLE